MNDFTKEELQMIYEDFKGTQHSDISERAKLMLDLEEVLQSRLESLEHLAQQGVIPGQIDSIELQRLNGRISELQFILELLAADRD